MTLHGMAIVMLLQAAPSTVTIDRLAAVVGGEPIFLSDVRDVMRLRLFDPQSALARLNAGADTASEAGVLERLIDRRLVLAEAARYSQAAPPEADVARAQEAWAARFTEIPSHDAALVRAFLVDTLRLDRYIEQRFSSAAQTEERRTAMIREWLNGLRERAQVRVLR